MNIKPLEITIYPDGRLDTQNAALYLGASEKTLAMWRCEGSGPKFIKRGRIFYFKDDLDQWLHSGGKSLTTSQARINNQSTIKEV